MFEKTLCWYQNTRSPQPPLKGGARIRFIVPLFRMSSYKIKKVPLLATIFSVVVINATVFFLAKSFERVLIVVWLSGSIPSLIAFFTVRFSLKLFQIFGQLRSKPTPSYGTKIHLRQRFIHIVRKLLYVVIGGLLTSSVGVILYWLLLTPLEMIGILSPIVDGLRKLSGQPHQYQEVYYMLIGIGISFLTAIPGMVLGQNLILDQSIAKQNTK